MIAALSTEKCSACKRRLWIIAKGIFTLRLCPACDLKRWDWENE